MQDTTTPGNGQAPKPKSKQPRLNLRFVDGDPISVDAEALEESDWHDLREQCDESDGLVNIGIVHLSRWPDANRYQLLSLAKHLGEGCRLKIGGKKFNDPFEAVLEAMDDAKSLAEQQRMQRAAIEAAAIFYDDVPEMVASKINHRLSEIGQPKVNHARLVKQIRQVAGKEEENESSGPQAAAGKFLAHLQKPDGQPNDGSQANNQDASGKVQLRYFQSDFYAWCGRVWERQHDQQFQARVMQFLQSLDLPNLPERFARDVIANLKAFTLLNCWRETMPFSVLQESPLMIAHPKLIVFNNGTLDLDESLEVEEFPEAGELDEFPEAGEFDSQYFNTICLPYDYDPDATCPLWLETLNDILPKAGDDDGRQPLLQEFFGYSLLPSCHLQKCFIMLGDGGNGKSTITTTWESMLGEENVSDIRLDELGDKFRTYTLADKLANFSGELPYLGKVNEAQFKRIVSGEPIDVDRKHKDPVKLRTTAKLIINSNSLPHFQDSTPATWDRLIVMPFDVRLRGTKKEDKNRVQHLKAELPGVFIWALQGLKRLLESDKFTNCEKCAAMTKAHRIESDSVLQFLSECCCKSKNYYTLSMPLYETYQIWAESTGRKSVQYVEFCKRLKRAGWKKKRKATMPRSYVYDGMKIRLDGTQYLERWKSKFRKDIAICYTKP